MPPKRSHSDGQSGRPPRKRKQPPKGTCEYKERRDKNNEAVKKSRERSRLKAKVTTDRVSKLRSENQELEQQVEILSKELIVLKDLFKSVHAGSVGGQCGVNSGTEAGIQTDIDEHAEDGAGASGDNKDGIVNLDAVVKDHEYFSKS